MNKKKKTTLQKRLVRGRQYLRFGRGHVRKTKAIFDAHWYANSCPDLEQSRLPPHVHYMEYGWKNGTSPSPLFDVSWYLGQFPGLKSKNVEPLGHYLVKGWKSGATPHPLFDPNWYLSVNKDVATSGVEPLTHYLRHGWLEGRAPMPLFDPVWYLKNNPDVENSGLEPFSHYLGYGWNEQNRKSNGPHPLIPLDWYERQNPDMVGTEPLRHYLTAKDSGSRELSPEFTASYYSSLYPELELTSPLDLFWHYSTKGRDQGLLAAPPIVKRGAQSVCPTIQEKTRSAPREGKSQHHAPLIIAGFHRSGTSMTANYLHEAGLFLGDELLGANYSNKYGHFEDVEVVNFHDRLLGRIGTSWQLDHALAPILEPEDRRWMVDFGSRRGIHHTWGLKDPRICLFLPQWAEVFPQMSVVYVFRPCVECVSSLKRRAASDMRNGFAYRTNIRFWTEKDLAVRMYLTYGWAALRFLRSFRGRKRVVTLDGLLMDRNLASELRQDWSYRLHDTDTLDVFDGAEMTRSGDNEVIHDQGLLREINTLENEFLKLAAQYDETTQ
ncbi:hypothetical protein [Ruegeria sp. HKCCA4633]|uniref:hypothetical protein n=1 Tax=Ruegeria sp. HKCCA4633 TaxID=2682983 RepID=UPI001488544A|nr:hypothetical protein [Ruegeria sp. HKCCA4633]